MLKVAFVIGTMGNGGAERVIAALANELASNGAEVRIITIYGNRQHYALADGVEMFPVSFKANLRLLRPVERIKAIRKAITDFKPDSVVSFLADVNIHTILACRGLSVPIIVSERNDPTKSPRQAWLRKLRNSLYKKAHGLVFQTPDAASYFVPYLKANNKTTIIPNPLTPNLPVYEHDEANTRLITACRLNEQKNLPMMIDAIAELKESGLLLSLDIFGEGPLRNSLQQRIEARNATDYIKLRGFSKDIHREMAQSACFVISSDYEGISNSMLEALAIGVPVVATDCPVGGARMFIQNGETGYLVPVGDKEAFKRAISDVMENREKARAMGHSAMALRNTLDVTAITRQWTEFISAVLEKGGICNNGQ
ncbi:MAG: glycosyltransferase family 4 protein [Ruminococcaceae bacterium]|nr:glycosyltransferase family 4 protein [Oscillospiraceae bacterium]